MRKRLITAFLLVVAAIVLGSTVFREQVVNAATTPFQNVVVTNTSTNPVPVHAGRHVDDERERNRRHRSEQEHRQLDSDTSTGPAGISRTSRARSASSTSTAAATSRRRLRPPRREWSRSNARTAVQAAGTSRTTPRITALQRRAST